MPNIWSRTNRKIYEAFKGPRTVDTDFNKKVEEIRSEERYLEHLQTIIQRFHESRETHKLHLKEINHFMMNCYDMNSHYWPYMNDIVNTHKELEKLHDNYIENVMRTTNITSDLNVRLNAIRENIRERDRLRFIHDHYDEKMEKYVRDRNRRAESAKAEPIEFVHGFERAAKNYIDQSYRTYKMMDDYIYQKPNYINPIISQEEIRFYNESSNLLIRLHGVSERFQAADLSRPLSNLIEYDPARFIRGHKILLSKSNVSEHIIPAESSVIRIVEDVPQQNTQEVIVHSMIPNEITNENKVEFEEKLREEQPKYDGVLININENAKDNSKMIDRENTGVLNVHNLYIPSPNENYRTQDGLQAYNNHGKQVIQDEEDSQYYEDSYSEISQLKNEYYNREQSAPKQSNNINTHHDDHHYEADQMQSNQNLNYMSNTIHHHNTEIPKQSNAENININQNPVSVREAYYTEQTTFPIINKIISNHYNDRQDYFIPIDKHRTSNHFNQIENDNYLMHNNETAQYYSYDDQPIISTEKNTFRIKSIESEDKLKLVYNLEPLIKSYIKANPSLEERDKNKEIQENESEALNYSKKMTAVSEEFLYTDPITNELLKVRISLKNRNTINSDDSQI